VKLKNTQQIKTASNNHLYAILPFYIKQYIFISFLRLCGYGKGHNYIVGNLNKDYKMEGKNVEKNVSF
jgi:hypothetical protein